MRLSIPSLLLFALLLCACNSGGPQTGDSNTNWLEPCDVDDTCPSTSVCVCGVCTRACATDPDCEGLGEAVVCYPSSKETLTGLCSPNAPERICIQAGCANTSECPDGLVCIEAACVPPNTAAITDGGTAEDSGKVCSCPTCSAQLGRCVLDAACPSLIDCAIANDCTSADDCRRIPECRTMVEAAVGDSANLFDLVMECACEDPVDALDGCTE